MAQAAALFAAPASKTVRTIEALRAAAEADPSKIAGAGVAAAPVVVETPAAAEEVVAEETQVADVAAEAAPTSEEVTAVEVEVVEAPAADAAETTEG
jgi:L-lysine 2,3-aminomutase